MVNNQTIDGEPECRTCGDEGHVRDGALLCSSGGVPYENGPIECFKDCPDCKAQGEKSLISVIANEMSRLGYGLHESHAESILCAIRDSQVKEDQGADKQLISALQGLLAAYEDPGNTGSTHDDKVQAARDAIAKATA